MIYLDNASTTEVTPEVMIKMMPYFMDEFYNPSSPYNKGVEIRQIVENARYIVAQSISAKKNEIYFTSGGSESNCWAIQGFVNHWRFLGIKPVVITSVIEHHSILECVDNLFDAEVHYVGVNEKGFVNTNQLKSLLQWCQDKPTLVSIQYANNEIGTIQYIKTLAEISHKYNAVFHSDAVQAYGQIFCNVNALNIDMLSVSGHKIGCPKGIGFLYIKQGIQINPLIYGTQNSGLRGGTENVPYIVGMATAIKGVINKEYIQIGNGCSKVRDYAIDKLTEKFHVTLNGDRYYAKRLPNNINVTFPNSVTGESLIHMLSASDIYISAGSACNSYIDAPSHVLKAIGLSDEEARRTIRITINKDITTEHIDYMVNEIAKAIQVIEL